VQGYEQFWKVRAAEAEVSGDADSIKQTTTHASNAREFGEHLKGITEQYQCRRVRSVLSLDGTIGRDETRTNIFARALLMPERAVKDQFKDHFGVSEIWASRPAYLDLLRTSPPRGVLL
jgi:hypothetical protein